jgi:hypothetical protein
MQKSLALLICAASVLSATCGAVNAGDNEAPAPAASTVRRRISSPFGLKVFI